jgi:hypothetical protein
MPKQSEDIALIAWQCAYSKGIDRAAQIASSRASTWRTEAEVQHGDADAVKLCTAIANELDRLAQTIAKT